MLVSNNKQRMCCVICTWVSCSSEMLTSSATLFHTCSWYVFILSRNVSYGHSSVPRTPVIPPQSKDTHTHTIELQGTAASDSRHRHGKCHHSLTQMGRPLRKKDPWNVWPSPSYRPPTLTMFKVTNPWSLDVTYKRLMRCKNPCDI